MKGLKMFARVKVSEETLKQGDLNHFQKGELRWKKLKEASDNGTLAFAKNRRDIAEIGGYNKDNPDEITKGVAWASNLVHRGHLSEQLDHFEGRKAVNSYALTGKEPCYGMSKTRAKKSRTKKPETKKPIEEIIRAELAKPRFVQVEPKTEARVNITKGDMTISIEVEATKAIELLTNILK